METFLTAHPDTVLVIIDTLQMVRPARDATYANEDVYKRQTMRNTPRICTRMTIKSGSWNK